MAFTSYATLQTAVNTWLRRTVTAADLQDMITLREAKLRRTLRVREMEATPALSVNAQSVALPTGFVGVRRIYLATDPVTKLEYYTPENFWAKFISSTTSKPTAYTIEGDNYIFGPSPDSTYTGRQLIYALTALSASNVPTLYTNHPDLYLYGVLLESEGYYGPNQFHNIWQERYDSAHFECIQSSAKDRAGGGVLVAHTQTRIG